MKCFRECVPCFVKQAVEAGKIAASDEKQKEEILKKCLMLIMNVDMNLCPPEIGMKIHAVVKFITGKRDPYKEIKDYYNKQGKNF